MSYGFPPGLVLCVVLGLLRGQARSLGVDSNRGLRHVAPLPRVLGVQHIPADGAFVIVGNHYERAGLWAGWGAMVANAAVWQASASRHEVHWLMTSELLDVRAGPLPVPSAWVRGMLARFARMYGMGLVSARESGMVGGSSGLRAAARYLAAGEPVGVLPEGTASYALREARPGVGLALAWLTRGGASLVPLGICERDGRLTGRFGDPFSLPEIAGDRASRDLALREVVMGRIAELLPPSLAGYYAGR